MTTTPDATAPTLAVPDLTPVAEAELSARLTEAEAVIINAQDALTPDHPVFWILDDYDGSMDSVQTLKRERDDARKGLAKARAVVEAAKVCVADIVETHPHIRRAQPGWFLEGTLQLVAAVDALTEPVQEKP